jgi:hypothetical protein
MAPGYHDATHHPRTRAWRDTIQAFTHDAAELPVIARLLAGQGVLLLGYASVYGALALRRRLRGVPAPRPTEETRSPAMPSSAMPSSAMPTPARAPRRSRPLLVGATAATGLAFAWAALVLIARMRAIPLVTALFTYGAALRQYVRPWRPPTRAA